MAMATTRADRTRTVYDGPNPPDGLYEFTRNLCCNMLRHLWTRWWAIDLDATGSWGDSRMSNYDSDKDLPIALASARLWLTSQPTEDYLRTHLTVPVPSSSRRASTVTLDGWSSGSTGICTSL